MLERGVLSRRPVRVGGSASDWQFYSGENTMSYVSQMSGLAWQSFVALGPIAEHLLLHAGATI